MPDPQRVPAIGEDVSALMPPVGADVTALMGGASATPAPSAPSPSRQGQMGLTELITGEAPKAPASVAQRVAAASQPYLGSTVSGALGTYADLNVGALKGAGNTIVSLSKLGTRLPGVKALMGRVYGLTPEQIDAQYAAADEALKPTNTTQAIGRAGEQIAETLVPGRMVSTAATKGAALLPRGVQTLGRMAVEGAGGAGMALAQGSDPRTAGVVSAAIPLGGALVRGGRQLVGGKVAPAMADAIEMAERRGIPVDAATTSGSKVTAAVQNLAGRGTFGGQIVRDAHEADRVAAMQRVAGDLAAEAHPEAVTRRAAGKAAREGVKAKVREFYDDANNAYADLRDIAARPENVRLVPKQVAKDAVETVAGEAAKEGAEEVVDTAMFRPTPGRKPDLWTDVLLDAKRNGFRGSPGTLRKLFDERMGQAQSLVDELSGANHGRAVLEHIRDAGGIGRAVEAEVGLQGRRFTGEVRAIWDMSTAAKAGKTSKSGKALTPKYFPSGGIAGVGNVVRSGGKSLETIAESLREAFPDMYHDISGNDVAGIIEEAARTINDAPVSALDALAQLGVRPGQQWWKPAHAVAEDAAEQFDEMALPVDLRPVKEGLKQLHAEITELMPVGRQQYQPGLKALDNLMNAPDYLPALQVDRNLSAIKAMARGAAMDELRTKAQGASAEAVKYLEDAVQRAVADAGPEAVAARTAGREATKKKAATSDILQQLAGKALQKTPGRIFRQLTTANDDEVDLLREVHRLAPREVPKIGRAYLERLFAKAGARDGWSRENSLLNEWQALGDETKALLYPNAALRRDLDAFFKLAVKAAENTNPSGSGWTWLLGTQAGAGVLDPMSFLLAQLGGATVAKLLYSPRGVRLLTQGLKMPTMSPAAAANVFEQLRRAGERAAATAPAAVPSTPTSAPGAPAR